MKRALAIGEALVLLALGVFMLGLSLSSSYWIFLNPKFRWITGSAGVVLILLGLASLAWRRQGVSWPALGLFALLMALILFMDPGKLNLPRLSLGAAPVKQRKLPSRVKFRQKTYVRINLGELYLIARQADQARLAQRYVLRGMIGRSSLLDGLNQYALMRVHMYCCLADAVAVGLRVLGEEPPHLPHGQWVRVYGRLQTAEPLPAAAQGLKPPGVFAVVISPNYVLKAYAIEKIPPPAIPTIFELRSKEPYAY